MADPDKDLVELLPKTKNKSSTKENASLYFNPESVNSSSVIASNTNSQPPGSTNRSSPSGRNMGPRGQNQGSSGNARVPSASNGTIGPPASMVWAGPPTMSSTTSPRRNQSKSSQASSQDKTVTRQLFPGEGKKGGGFGTPNTTTNTTVSYSLASSASKVTTTGSSIFNKSDSTRLSANSKQGPIKPPVPGSVKVLQRPGNSKQDPQPLPIISQQNGMPGTTNAMTNGPFIPPSSVPGSMSGSFSPFNNLFSNVAEQFLKKDDVAERMNFASVAAAGLVGSSTSSSPTPDLAPLMQNLKVDPHLQAKAPGFRPVNIRNPNPQDIDMARAPGYKGIPMMMNDMDLRMRVSVPNHSPALSPRSASSTPGGGISPRGNHLPTDVMANAGQKMEYSTPSQPMTLPKIESTLNPNAPDFTSRQAGGPMGNQPVGPGGMPLAMGYLQNLYQQALAQQLLQSQGLGKYPVYIVIAFFSFFSFVSILLD